MCGVFVLSAVLACGVAMPQPAEAKKLKDKTYKDDYTIDGGEVLEGEGPGKTTIKGNIRVKDSGVLRNLTVDGGQITLGSGASLTIENVVVDDAPGTAIETRGGGSLIVRNSQIINSDGKAFYIQTGKHIVITGSVIRGAGEEGIDIRDGVSGVISGNTIVGNKESGIEVILGAASLQITNNNLSNNGSSGIAAQYYSLEKAIGNVAISGNTLANNSNYGLDCKTPSGGNPGAGYWDASTTFVDNKISGNGEGNIAPRCGVANVDSEAVRIAREKAEEEARKKAEEEARRKAEEERRRKEIAEQRRVLDEVEPQVEERINAIKEKKVVIDQQWWVRSYLLGAEQSSVDALRAEYNGLMESLARMDDLKQQELDEAERVRVESVVGRIGVVREPLENYIDEKSRGALFGKIASIFR